MPPYTILILLSATPQWLALSRSERTLFYERSILPLFKQLNSSLSVRFFDSEYFHARISDFLIISATELDQYKLLIELLRDSPVYAVPYFTVQDIVIGQENLFERFDSFFKSEQS